MKHPAFPAYRLPLGLLALACLATACAGSPPAQPLPPYGPARAVVVGGQAVVPGCPDQREERATDARNLTSPNYGCATAAILAAMVVVPMDVEMGRTPGPAIAPDPKPAAGPAAGDAGGLGAMMSQLGGAGGTPKSP